MSDPTTNDVILLELDDATWSAQLDRAAAWLNNTIMTQEKFRKFAADVASEIREPHVKAYLEDVAKRAEDHEKLARDLIQAIGREPTPGRSAAGAVLAKGAELVADVVGLAGGARGDWKDLRQLLLAGQDALGAFAIVEQLGYALGMPELAEPAFRAQGEKMRDQLLIQEFMLEMGPMAILLREEI